MFNEADFERDERDDDEDRDKREDLGNGYSVAIMIEQETDAPNPFDEWIENTLLVAKNGDKQSGAPEDYVVWLDRYDHSGTVWGVSGELAGRVQYPEWDLSHNAGQWVAGKTEQRDFNIRKFWRGGKAAARAALVERATQDIATYNQWLSGDVWLVHSTVFYNDEEIGHEGVAGVYGLDDAQNEARQIAAGIVKAHKTRTQGA